MASKQQQVRAQILHKKVSNPDMSHNDIAKSLKVPKSTVTLVLKNFSQRLTLDRKTGSGGNHDQRFIKQRKAVIEAFKHKPNLSVRDVAKKVKMSPSFVQKVKKNAGLKSFKVGVAPNRNDEQNRSAKTRARKLYDTLLNKYDCVVLDDETYCKADFKQIPGLEFYTAMQRGKVQEHFKQKKLSKFPKKYLVWQALCSCGLRSEIFVTTGTVNSAIYVKECLQKRLLPFIRKHGGEVLFWPDLASCHYSKATKEWYTANNVHFVPKECNPPNTPELRPIETYWALVKRNLLKTNKTAGDEKDFKRKWISASKKVTPETVRDLMGGIKRKCRSWFRNKKIT